MARLTIYIVALALGAAAAVGLVSCGGSDDELLPGSDASQILDNLDSVEEEVAVGDCDGAFAAAQEVSDQVERLPRSVDAELRQQLAEGAQRLEDLAASDCQEPPTVTETTDTTDEETETKETETTETEPTHTETTETTETEPTETEPTQTEAPTATATIPPTSGGGSGGIGPGQGSGGGPP
jgi:hypothetical protein